MKNLEKSLQKAYVKRFKQLNKNMFNANNSGLLLFVEHLKYLRDHYTLTNKSTEVDPYIISIDTAINEFEVYQESKKEFHWNNFCEFIKLNMGEWLATNDSV